MAMQGAPILAGVWVFFDARGHGIPRPLRWALGTMLVLAFVFPWYLARRRKPQASVPFVEAEMGPVTRFLLIALMIFMLASLIFYFVHGPSPIVAPTPSVKEHRNDRNSQPRITDVRKDRNQRWRPAEQAPPLSLAWSAQTVTNAPSDAWQT
jgi:hypothetical protein